MDINCEWCGGKATKGEGTVYWEMPDGSRSFEITATPAVICKECGMVYQTDKVTKEIEDQLFLVNTKLIGNTISFKELLELPRLLKRNYIFFLLRITLLLLGTQRWVPLSCDKSILV